MRLLAAAALFLFASCGQPAAPPPSAAPPTPAASAAADTGSADMGAAEMQARVAALPAPYNEADYEAGRRAFGQCRSCHTVEEGAPNRVGPNLHGVFGRAAASAPGFAYSQAVQGANFAWDAEHLDHWLANPQTFLPGNRMAFAGVRNDQQRRDVIAYLMVESAPR